MCLSYQIVDEIGQIVIDHPPVNALSARLRQALQAAIETAQSDASKALLLICKGRTFIAGADIREFGKPPESPALPDLINAIEASTKPIIAALHGTALGGGFEVAMGCHYRIAADSARVGLPEVNLGLLPGAGGTQRAPRLAGSDAALAMMLDGKPVDAARALQLGLVDKVVAGNLQDEAMAYARELVASGAEPRRSSSLSAEPLSEAALEKAQDFFARRARGQTAPPRILAAVQAATDSFEIGSQRERELFLDCMDDPQSAALRHLFFAERDAARVDGIDRDTAQRDIRAAGIIGAGTMGAGIAVNFIQAGIPVTLVETRDDALERGLNTIDGILTGGVKRGKLSEASARQCRERVTGTLEMADLADVDLVVEAVFEDPTIKAEVFAKLDTICRPGAILATNTSYQDVNAIAAATGRPEDVLGLHFFSPAHIMRLLEVVRTNQTADDVLATCMALSRRIGKTPVLAGVGYGFIGNRMLIPYMREAQLCLLEGASVDAIDAAMVEWGMAMGPLAVADLAGLDVSYKARQAQAPEERGDPRHYRIADVLVESGRLGRKSGGGFYDYAEDSGKPAASGIVENIAAEAASEFGVTRRDIAAEEIVDRLVLALANEGFKVLDEGIAQRASDIDVVYAHGYGFPRWRGGPMFAARARGYDSVLARIREFGERLDSELWQPAAGLIDAADQ